MQLRYEKTAPSQYDVFNTDEKGKETYVGWVRLTGTCWELFSPEGRPFGSSRTRKAAASYLVIR
ncbi:hypothetical protein AS149_12670 [Burkholderia cenocepacia]|nr:hypothetical protein AS149_12670 [Burkholderia cenocepacia]